MTSSYDLETVGRKPFQNFFAPGRNIVGGHFFFGEENTFAHGYVTQRNTGQRDSLLQFRSYERADPVAFVFLRTALGTLSGDELTVSYTNFSSDDEVYHHASPDTFAARLNAVK